MRMWPNGWCPSMEANSRTPMNASSALYRVSAVRLFRPSCEEPALGPRNTRPVSMAEFTTSAFTVCRPVSGFRDTRMVWRSHCTGTSAALNIFLTDAHKVGPKPSPSISVTRKGCPFPPLSLHPAAPPVVPTFVPTFVVPPPALLLQPASPAMPKRRTAHRCTDDTPLPSPVKNERIAALISKKTIVTMQVIYEYRKTTRTLTSIYCFDQIHEWRRKWDLTMKKTSNDLNTHF